MGSGAVVLDCIDQVRAKAALIAHCKRAGNFVVASGAAGGRGSRGNAHRRKLNDIKDKARCGLQRAFLAVFAGKREVRDGAPDPAETYRSSRRVPTRRSQVRGPTMPSAVRPKSRWKACTAFSVAGP